MCNSKANHPQKKKKTNKKRSVPQICILRFVNLSLKNQSSFACHVIMSLDVNYDHSVRIKC